MRTGCLAVALVLVATTATAQGLGGALDGLGGEAAKPEGSSAPQPAPPVAAADARHEQLASLKGHLVAQRSVDPRSLRPLPTMAEMEEKLGRFEGALRAELDDPHPSGWATRELADAVHGFETKWIQLAEPIREGRIPEDWSSAGGATGLAWAMDSEVYFRELARVERKVGRARANADRAATLELLDAIAAAQASIQGLRAANLDLESEIWREKVYADHLHALKLRGLEMKIARLEREISIGEGFAELAHLLRRMEDMARLRARDARPLALRDGQEPATVVQVPSDVVLRARMSGHESEGARVLAMPDRLKALANELYRLHYRLANAADVQRAAEAHAAGHPESSALSGHDGTLEEQLTRRRTIDENRIRLVHAEMRENADARLAERIR